MNNFGQSLAVLKIFNTNNRCAWRPLMYDACAPNATCLLVFNIFNTHVPEISKMNKISLCNIFIEGKEADVSWITFKSPKAE